MSQKQYNILFFSSFGSVGRGGQESLLQLVKNIDRDLFNPHVVVPNKGSLSEKLSAFNVNYTVLKIPKIKSIRFISIITTFIRLNNLCRKKSIHLIHTDGPRNTLYAGIIARLRRLPLIWHVRASNPDILDRVLYLLSSKIILVAGKLKSRFRWTDKYHKISIVYNGVDISGSNSTNNHGYIRKKYGIGQNDIIVLAIARIERLKGQRFLIQACGRLNENTNDVYLLFAGEVTEPLYLDQCRKIARSLGILERMVFSGKVNNVADLIHEADIFVSPSLFEAFPRSILEAMGAGKPVIVTDVGGCSEAVEDKISGFVVPPRNSIALAEKINLLKLDENLRNAMGEAARKRVENHFSIELHTEKVQNIYQKVLLGNVVT